MMLTFFCPWNKKTKKQSFEAPHPLINYFVSVCCFLCERAFFCLFFFFFFLNKWMWPCVPSAALGHMNKHTSAGEESENMIIFVWVNELLTPVLQSLPAKAWEALLVFGMYSMGWGWLSRGHCLVKLKAERWHAVSLSWRSLLNALAPPDMPYSGREDRRVPAACRKIPPFNWALTRDSFHSSPQATLGADKTVQVTTLGFSLFRIRKRQRLQKMLTFKDIIPVSATRKPH